MNEEFKIFNIIQEYYGIEKTIKHVTKYNIDYSSLQSSPQVVFLAIHDEYSINERTQMYESIIDLFNPETQYGFSSGGLYFFWDTDTREILYIGMTINILDRFKQHNFIGGKGTKKNKIDKFFEKKDKIGYTILVQSKLEQPENRLIKKDKNIHLKAKDKASTYLKDIESILINEFKRREGNIPKWNVDNGLLSGRNGNEMFTPLLNIVNLTNTNSLFLSRSTIRELSNNPIFETYENNILAKIRIFCAGLGFYIPLINNDYISEYIEKTTDFSLINKDDFLKYIKI